MTKLIASDGKLRDFGLLVGVIVIGFIGLILPAITGHGFRTWTLWIGIPAIILGCLAPQMLRYPYKWWMALGHALGYINSHLVLGLVFIVILQPIALCMRLMGYDPLNKRTKGLGTYRKIREDYQVDLKRLF